jgi:predicted RNA binding protein YcfA (HicA-like mRNA interferase family)
MKINEAMAKLKKRGCYFARHKGDHDWWYSPITKSYFPIPRHGAHELPDGTKARIEKLSGVKL